MENDSIVTQVAETVQDTSAYATMTEGIRKLATTPVSEWLPDLVKEHFSSKKAAPKPRKEIRLDSDAIESAQENLRRTTEMMSVEEGEKPIAERRAPGPSPPENPSEGWEGLVSSLSENQKEVLAGMIADPEGAARRKTRVVLTACLRTCRRC